MVPSHKDPTLGKSLFYISGGVMATLLAGIIFLMLFIFNPFSLNPQILFFLLSLSLSFFLNTGINISSYYSDGIPTDGKLIWNIIFKSSTFPEYYINMTNIGRSLEYGIRPKRIPMKDFDLSKDPSSFDIIFILNLYYKALDDKDISSAMKYFRLLEKNISKVPENLAYHVNGELCFINCVIGNSDKSAYYYEKIKDAIENKFDMTSLRIRAYFEYYADHDNSASLFFLKAALCSRDNFENKGLIPLETRFIKELLQKI